MSEERRVREAIGAGASSEGNVSGSSYSMALSKNLEVPLGEKAVPADALSAKGSSTDTTVVRTGGGGGARRDDVGIITDDRLGRVAVCHGCACDPDEDAVTLAGAVRETELRPEPRPRGGRDTLGRCTKADACGEDMTADVEVWEKLNGFPNAP